MVHQNGSSHCIRDSRKSLSARKVPPLPGKTTPLSIANPGAWRSHSICRYSETVKSEVRRRMGPPQRQSLAQISKEFGIYVATPCRWRFIGVCRGNWCRHPQRAMTRPLARGLLRLVPARLDLASSMGCCALPMAPHYPAPTSHRSSSP